MADLDQPFNITLREMRESYDMTQAEAAEAIGVTQGTLSRIESCVQMASADQFIALAELYGGSIKIMLGNGRNPDRQQAPFVVWNVDLTRGRERARADGEPQ